MTKRNKKAEYLEKMRQTIIDDLKDDRSMHAIAGSINVSSKELGEWRKENNLKDLYGEPEVLSTLQELKGKI
jgi:exonuclease III